MKDSKLFIIGIDGLDPTLLSEWAHVLPTFSELARCGVNPQLRSILPSDSIPAWATIYTGTDPSEHGILGSVDYLKGVDHIGVGVDMLRGNTFWDKASRAGKRVCILNPFLAYPAWPVNGMMISGPPLWRGEPTAFPASVMRDYEIPELGGFPDIPSREDLENILLHCVEATDRLCHFGLQLLEKADWDLFFICFLTLDRVEHFFWRFGDNQDPYFPGTNRFQNAIKEFYIRMDKIVETFYGRIDPDNAFMVVSDHGHRRRATKLLNLNEFLLRKGFLKPKGRITSRILERTRSSVVTIAQRLRAEQLLFKFGRLFPKATEIRESRFSLDYNRSIATLADFGGSTCYGGIRFNRDAMKIAGLDYRFTLQTVANAIGALKDPTTNQELVRELYFRDQIYKGVFAEKLPDIIFELDHEYGLHWSIHDKMIIPDYAHRLVSGGHSREAVFLLSRSLDPPKTSLDLTDIAPIILNILGVPSGDHGRESISDS